MIVIAYSMDCALIDVILRKMFNIHAVFYSKTKINKFIEENLNNIECVVGYNNIEYEYEISRDFYIIDNNPKTHDEYFGEDKTYIDVDSSNSLLFMKYILNKYKDSIKSLDPEIKKLLQISEAIYGRNALNIKSLINLYELLGLKHFINRMLSNPLNDVTSEEHRYIEHGLNVKKNIIDSYIQQEGFEDDYIFMCRLPYEYQKYLLSNISEDSFLLRYMLWIFWDIKSDGDISVIFKSTAYNLAGKVSEKLGGKNFKQSGFLNIPYRDDIEEYLINEVKEIVENIREESF